MAKRRRKLKSIVVEEISLVDKPANKRRFMFQKAEAPEGFTMTQEVNVPTDPRALGRTLGAAMAPVDLRDPDTLDAVLDAAQEELAEADIALPPGTDAEFAQGLAEGAAADPADPLIEVDETALAAEALAEIQAEHAYAAPVQPPAKEEGVDHIDAIQQVYAEILQEHEGR